MSTRTPTPKRPPAKIVIDLPAFDRVTAELGHKTDADRARALHIDHGVISRLRSGKSNPGTKFVSQVVQLGIPFAAVFKVQTGADQ